MTYFESDEDTAFYYRDKKIRLFNIRMNDEQLSCLDYLCEYYSRLYDVEFNRSMTVRKLIEDEYFMRKFQRF